MFSAGLGVCVCAKLSTLLSRDVQDTYIGSGDLRPMQEDEDLRKNRRRRVSSLIGVLDRECLVCWRYWTGRRGREGRSFTTVWPRGTKSISDTMVFWFGVLGLLWGYGSMLGVPGVLVRL